MVSVVGFQNSESENPANQQPVTIRTSNLGNIPAGDQESGPVVSRCEVRLLRTPNSDSLLPRSRWANFTANGDPVDGGDPQIPLAQHDHSYYALRTTHYYYYALLKLQLQLQKQYQ